jgi:hypothetical protein
MYTPHLNACSWFKRSLSMYSFQSGIDSIYSQPSRPTGSTSTNQTENVWTKLIAFVLKVYAIFLVLIPSIIHHKKPFVCHLHCIWYCKQWWLKAYRKMLIGNMQIQRPLNFRWGDTLKNISLRWKCRKSKMHLIHTIYESHRQRTSAHRVSTFTLWLLS